jgi:hypothetical protein
MTEKHGSIDRIEYYYVVKAWYDKENGKEKFAFDHNTAASKFQDGMVWNNKIGEWSQIDTEDKAQADIVFIDEIWNKLGME